MRRLLVLLLLLALSPAARALDTVRAGNSADVAWTFVPLDVGMAEGIFAKYGIAIDKTSFDGDQKLQVALASGSVDIGLGGGPAMAFAVKGAPVIAVAAFAREPRNIALIVGPHSDIRTLKDLKGKRIGSSAPGSLTGWLVQRVSESQGWGPNGIEIAALGGFEVSFAALRTHQIDGMMGSVEAGLGLEQQGTGRILATMQQFAPVFITHAVFARRRLVAQDPDLVRRFLKGFFASIAYMRTHKAETSRIAVRVMHETPQVANRAYDDEIGMFEDDGTFDPKAVAALKASFVEMGAFKTEPRDDQMFTTEFLPVQP